MPYALVAGTVVAKPKVDHFPKAGRPRAEITLRVDDAIGELHRVVAYDDLIPEVEVLQPNDAIAVQGTIELEKSTNGFYVVESSRWRGGARTRSKRDRYRWRADRSCKDRASRNNNLTKAEKCGNE